MRLSVLDQSPIAEGSTIGDGLRNTIELAQLADRLGFHRYWLAEHHRAVSLACASPEDMIGPVAQATKRIRVGSGGIMLPHYSALKVAESFLMLGGLYEGRIDLGLGRAPGTSGKVALLLQRDRRQRPPDDFPDQLDELTGYLKDTDVEPYLLGSSGDSSIWAAERGLPYVFADFIYPAGAPFANHYREYFVPSARRQNPYVGVCVWSICAETDEEALRLSLSARMMLLHLFRGQPIMVPPIEKAEEFLRREGAPFEILPAGRRLLVGSPQKVRREIEAVAASYQADEVFVVNILYDHQARLKSYELLARVFGSVMWGRLPNLRRIAKSACLKRCYRNPRPDISLGCPTPSIPRIVGAISCKRPPQPPQRPPLLIDHNKRHRIRSVISMRTLSNRIDHQLRVPMIGSNNPPPALPPQRVINPTQTSINDLDSANSRLHPPRVPDHVRISEIHHDHIKVALLNGADRHLSDPIRAHLRLQIVSRDLRRSHQFPAPRPHKHSHSRH